MDANIRNARADRLHALFVRNGRRFRDVAFAARLAFDRLEQLAPTHPDYRAIRAVADRAAASMATLNARSIRLARAEIAAVLAAGTMATLPAQASDPWTDTQQTEAIGLATLTVINWAQEHTRARQSSPTSPNSKYIPGQPGLAYAASYQPTSQPASDTSTGDIGRINRQFLLGIAVGALVLDALPTGYRDTALQAGLVISASCVGNDLRLGIKF